MGIMLRSFVEVADISIDYSTYLTIFEKRFAELIREIMRENNHFINVSFLYDIIMFTDSAQVFEVTLLLKRSEVANYINIGVIGESVF
jgi:hypothetical protein